MKRIFKLTILAFFAVSMSSCGYNSMVSKSEAVDSQWAQVQNVYQRRADLVPNLVNTVKGAANFEKSTLTAVVEARAKASSMNIDASKLDESAMKKFQAAQGQLSGALSRLLVTVERYPELKANQNFLELQAQLEGTENRISVERKKFNETTRDYNSYIKQFPRVIYASWFDFSKKPYFEADSGAEKVPEVQF